MDIGTTTFEPTQPFLLSEERQNAPIFIFGQFFLPSNPVRYNELVLCLRHNVSNPHIDKIYLLNERQYTDEELGVSSPKIEQHIIGHRLLFQDVFAQVQEKGLNGYIVLVNSDICLADDIQIVKRSFMHEQKILLALLRYDLKNETTAELFGPRYDSQDTWIYHSRFNPTPRQQTVFNIPFGKMGCDNAVAFRALMIGFNVINCPDKIKTVHEHRSGERTYDRADKVASPYAMIYPPQLENKMGDQYGMVVQNSKLRTFLEMADKPFLIPRIAGVETNCALVGKIFELELFTQGHLDAVRALRQVMKRNAGIQISSLDDLLLYSKLFFEAFERASMYFIWEEWGNVYKYIKQSHDYVVETYPREKIWAATTLDIFNHIHSRPWTHGLRGKRVLLISIFADSIREKIPIRDRIYGVDLFPECELIVCKPPVTHGTMPSRPFHIELAEFVERVRLLEFDVALVSCGGYGNLVCSAIFQMGRSAIYVGGVLQMYFGIIGNRWIKETPHVLALYQNEYWTRPKPEEIPTGAPSIENGCYW